MLGFGIFAGSGSAFGLLAGRQLFPFDRKSLRRETGPMLLPKDFRRKLVSAGAQPKNAMIGATPNA